jgi:hypothetical protein
MTFDQQASMQRLIETLARMDLPGDLDVPVPDDEISRAIDDAQALYDLIAQAREILKQRAIQ